MRFRRLTFRAYQTHLIFAFSLGLCLAASFSASAQSVDASQVLNDILQKNGPVQKSRTVKKFVDGKDCGTDARGHEHCWPVKYPISTVETYTEVLHVIKAEIVSFADVSYGKPTFAAISPKTYISSITGINCTNSNQTINTSLSLQYQTNQSVRWSKTVNDGESHTLGLSFNQSYSYGGGTAGQTESGSISFSHEVSTTDAKDEGWTHSAASSEQVVRTVPPMTQVWGRLQVNVGEMVVPFSAQATIDGDVDANDDNLLKVSDITDRQFGDDDARVITIGGAIHATTASGDIVTFYETPLTAASCAEHSGMFRVLPN